MKEETMRKDVVLLSILLGISILFNIGQAIRIDKLKERLNSQPQQQSSSKEQSKNSSKTIPNKSIGSFSPAEAGLVKGLGRNVLIAELSKWSSIGLVTNYEFSDSKVIVYLNHSDWISLPYATQADFKAGIRLKWPDGSVNYRDSQTGESL